MRRVSHVADGAMIEMVPHHAAGAEPAGLLEYLQPVGELLFHFVPLGIPIGSLGIRTSLAPSLATYIM
jgi:hypothetical protein